MMTPLSDKDSAVLLGATLMHWGVPFHTVAKRELTDDEQTTVDAASAKLIDLRESYQRSATLVGQGVLLSDEEISLLIEVVENCLAECGNSSTELSLQLKTSQRQEVEALLSRLNRCVVGS